MGMKGGQPWNGVIRIHDRQCKELGDGCSRKMQRKRMFFVIVVVAVLARQEAQHQINNSNKNNHAGDAKGRALGVGHDLCQGARREGDNGNDDCCLHCWLSFNFKVKFHAQSKQ
jgi:hypothetical protein